jgi:hypothetical protein
MPATLSLDVIDVARPCPADWNAMRGDDRSRYCDHCQKHVYDLSAMTREAAEALITEKEGNLCGRFYRRVDGTVITSDCGGGWKLRARKLGTLVGVACAAVLSGICAPLVYSQDSIASGQAINDAPTARLAERIIQRLKGTPPAPPPMVMGMIVCPPVPTPPPRTPGTYPGAGNSPP